MNEQDANESHFKEFLLLVCFLLIIVTIRQLIVRFNWPIPCDVFVLVLAFLIGLGFYYIDKFRNYKLAVYLYPYESLYVYLPILIFNITFCMDQIVFLKMLPQILIISIPAAIVHVLTFGMGMRLVVNKAWSIPSGIKFAVFCLPMYPLSVIHLLKKESLNTKQIAVFLEGEAIFSIIFVHLVFSIVFGTETKLLKDAPQVVIIVVRLIVVGSLIGWILGLLGRYLLRRLACIDSSVHLFCIIYPFFVFSLCQLFVSGNGALPVAIVGIMLSGERIALSSEVNEFLVNIWTSISFVMDVVMTLSVTCIFVTKYAFEKEAFTYLSLTVTYVLFYGVRFMCFLLAYPLISRIGYGMNMKNLILSAWCGVKNPFSLVLARVFYDTDVMREDSVYFYFHIFGLLVLSKFINASFAMSNMRFLGLTAISRSRIINMNICLNHLYKLRDTTVSILKMDKFMADTNWPLVMEATTIKHPYHVQLQEEDLATTSYHYSTCPECTYSVRTEPTAWEVQEIRKEARLRILKNKKICYSRLNASGYTSKEVNKALNQIIEHALDSEEALVNMQQLEKKFTEENYINRCIRHRIHEMHRAKTHNLRIPKRYIRRLSYKIVNFKYWEQIMLVVVTIHVSHMIFETIYNKPLIHETEIINRTQTADFVTYILNINFFFIYYLECVLKILGNSWQGIRRGIKIYFKSAWNIMDFIYVLIMIIHVCLRSIYMVTGDRNRSVLILNTVWHFVCFFRAVRLLRLLEIFYPRVLQSLDANMDLKVAFSYELGKCYFMTESEIIDMLEDIIDYENIQNEVRERCLTEKNIVSNCLSTVQKDKRWVAIAVKSKQCVRMILKDMEEEVNQLKAAGWLDNYEYHKLHEVLEALLQTINTAKPIHASSPKVLFEEVIWMGKDKSLVEFLLDNVIVKKYEPGDIVFKEEDVADGIYILVMGLLIQHYTPDGDALFNMNEQGWLPIVDYIPEKEVDYETETVDYIVAGNCVGELSVLTGRGYNCKITADVHSQIYVVKTDVLEKAMAMDPDPCKGLSCRIWKAVGGRIAVPLLLNVPLYQNYTHDNLRYNVERCFVPDLRNYKTFVVTALIQDIILLEGIIADLNTRETYVAPCYIPRTVQTLLLSKSSEMNTSDDVTTRLMIIPEQSMDEFDVMLIAEETCEMVAMPFEIKCLRHTAQSRLKLRKEVKAKLGKLGLLQQSMRQRKLAKLTYVNEDLRGMPYTNYMGEKRSSFFYR